MDYNGVIIKIAWMTLVTLKLYRIILIIQDIFIDVITSYFPALQKH